jgi:hypothetical protein
MKKPWFPTSAPFAVGMMGEHGILARKIWAATMMIGAEATNAFEESI